MDALPTIKKITPVPTVGATTTLTVTGTGFQSGLAVTSTVPGATFGAVTGQTATTFQVAITVPGTDTSGSYKLTVTNPDGGKAAKALTVSGGS